MALTNMFGGKADKTSHFTADVRYLMPDERDLERDRAKRYNAPTRRREQHAALKALGFKQRYFQFQRGDEAGKAKAKAACEAFATEWSAKVGFELEVAEGCFL